VSAISARCGLLGKRALLEDIQRALFVSSVVILRLCDGRENAGRNTSLGKSNTDVDQ
jgi:hypothetical protein